jgi:hypothetical protein
MFYVVNTHNPFIQIYKFEVDNHLHEYGITQCILMLGNCQFSIVMGITHQKKATYCSHALIHTLGSSKLITTISSCWIIASSLNLSPNNKEYGEYEKEAC